MGIRKRLVVALVISTCLGALTTGCTKTASGSPEWVKSEASKSVDKSDIEGLVLEPKDVESVVGADLVDVYNTNKPVSDTSLTDCQVFALPGQASLLGDDWDAFQVRTLDDQLDENENANYLVGEVAIIYSDADAAKASFENTLKMAQDCDGTERESTSGHTWKSKIEQSDDHSITWTDEQTDLVSEEWRCAGDARRRNNVVLRVLTCRSDNDGLANSTAIANEMSNKVWELSSPDK